MALRAIKAKNEGETMTTNIRTLGAVTRVLDAETLLTKAREALCTPEGSEMDMLSDMIDDLIHEADVASLPEWDGAPLHFTTARHTPDELRAAFARWQQVHGRLGSIPSSRMWHDALIGGGRGIREHTIARFHADTRCQWYLHEQSQPGADRVACYCVGDLLTQFICEPCGWRHIGTEHDCVLAWHDHALPGWRDLPALPGKLRGQMGTKLTPKVQTWLEDNYPPEFLIEGAPIITLRESRLVGRAIPGYSPLGGYDIGLTDTDEPDHA